MQVSKATVLLAQSRFGLGAAGLRASKEKIFNSECF